jgi:hypothetical protein
MPSFDSYIVEIRGNGPGVSGPRAHVRLRADTSEVGMILFWDSLSPTKVDSEASGVITINLPISVLAGVLDVLRQEKPLNIAMSGSGRGVLSTARAEPVGEEET